MLLAYRRTTWQERRHCGDVENGWCDTPFCVLRRRDCRLSVRAESLSMSCYFEADLFRFLTRLKRSNKRDWFLAHKDEYEKYARDPGIRFISDFAVHLSEISPYLMADPRSSRGSLFRIYRDTRFSADKRPYKTNVAMRFSHRGKDVHSPGFYLHLEPGGLLRGVRTLASRAGNAAESSHRDCGSR